MKLAVLVPCRDNISPYAFEAITAALMRATLYWRDKYPGKDADVIFIMRARAHVHVARWEMLQEALKRGADWLMWFDDDAVPPVDVIERLHKHDKDIVVPWFTTRMMPAKLVQSKLAMLPPEKVGDKGTFVIVPLGNPSEVKELTKIGVSGFHTLLMKRASVDKMLAANKGSSLFQYMAGPIGSPDLGEDAYFCQCAAVVGIEIWLDPSFCVGHVGTYIYDITDVPER